ncbi:DUF1289 domain-containing protein [Aestuariibius sp. 2305UL40-4]|uniref:DUF1289 domain-containing protein n=1 Tax=Aestuariibius violaceus TaxID=3234132 RepID=UPI00345EE696
MSDDIWQRDEVESPCVKICILHPEEKICTGCLRTLQEIGGWSRMTPEARRAVIADLPARAPRLQRRRGGRARRQKRAAQRPD